MSDQTCLRRARSGGSVEVYALVKLAIEGVSANFALEHTVRPADLCECKG